jgi:mono/diheme cytochrome c family protein
MLVPISGVIGRTGFSGATMETAPVPASGITLGRQAKTIWDGVYTEEQAKRAEPVYSRRCSSCHRPDLGGDEQAPALRDGYWAIWRGHTVAEFLRTVRVKMPLDAPGELTDQNYIDLISFLLRENGSPPGSSELPVDFETLDQITFTAKP